MYARWFMLLSKPILQITCFEIYKRVFENTLREIYIWYWQWKCVDFKYIPFLHERNIQIKIFDFFFRHFFQNILECAFSFIRLIVARLIKIDQSIIWNVNTDRKSTEGNVCLSYVFFSDLSVLFLKFGCIRNRFLLE